MGGVKNDQPQSTQGNAVGVGSNPAQSNQQQNAPTSNTNQANNNNAREKGHGTGQAANGKESADQHDPHPEGTRLGHYVLGKALGKGTFGKVKLAVHTLTNEKVAIKILEKSRIKDKKDIERISREIKILKKVRHPNVIQLFEIIETESELFLIMEFCQNGELFDYIVSHQRLHEKAAVRMYQQLIAGIEYIHKSGICHRDLKPENLLLDYDKTLKIVDFGLSNMYTAGSSEQLKTACGSPCYAAPEMIAGKKYLGLKSDIWSSGVVLYAMVCGFLPFEDPKTSNLYKKILAGDFKIPKFLSQDCAHFLTKILNTDPEKRYGIEEIRNHVWFKQQKDRRPEGLFPGQQPMPVNDKLYQMMLDEFNYDPDYSVKCIEANRHNQITATYHLLTKKTLRADKNFLDQGEAGTANMIGSLDRGQRPTRLQQQELAEQAQQRQRMNLANQTLTHGGGQHKRGQTITGQVRGGEQPMSSINQAQGAAVNLLDVSQNHQGSGQGPEISAQKKYKLELQAEINKLRSKYQDYSHIQNEIRLSNQVNANAVANQAKHTGKKSGSSQGQNRQPSQHQLAAGHAEQHGRNDGNGNRNGQQQAAQGGHNGQKNQPQAATKMAQVAITSPIKIQAVHNRPQLQTIQHGGHSRQANNDTMQSRNSTYSNTSNIKGIVNSAGGQNLQGQNVQRKMGPQPSSEPSSAAFNDYNRKASVHKGGNQTQIMGMTNAFSSMNSGSSGAHHVRYQSQLQQQQTKLDMQNRMNMTIQHNREGYSGLGQHGPPQYAKNQHALNSTSMSHQINTAAQGMRPSKIQNIAAANNTMNPASGNNQNAWRAYDMNAAAAQKQASASTQPSSQQHQRHASNRFTSSQMQMHPNAQQQFGTIVHPSIIKTNNLMMDSLMQGIGTQKMQAQLNNTITSNMANYNTFGGARESMDARAKASTVTEKTPNSALNSRNWRNKSIDTTPEHHDHYQYQVAKRAGSTAVGERQHNQTMPLGKNQNLNATTDYSYSIGPPGNQYKQGSAMNAPSGGQRHPQKFADLKFHHTAIDFNKTQQANNSLNSTLQSQHQNQQAMKGTKYSGNKKQYEYSGNGMAGTTSKKTNHSVDLGNRAASTNVTQNLMIAKNGQQAQVQTPGAVGQQMMGNFARPFNPNHSQMHPSKMNSLQVSTGNSAQGINGMNLQDLYKQYGTKPMSEYVNEHVQNNGFAQNVGQSQMQQYFSSTQHSGQMQRSAATGQTKHRAISVTEAPKPLMETNPQYLGFQKSVNSGIGHLNPQQQAQQYPQSHMAGGNNHFNNRHSSQSSQQHNRKNQFKEFFGNPPGPQQHPSGHQRNSGMHQMPASAGTQISAPGPNMANGSMLVTTQPGGGPMTQTATNYHSGSMTASSNAGYAAAKNIYGRKFK